MTNFIQKKTRIEKVKAPDGGVKQGKVGRRRLTHFIDQCESVSSFYYIGGSKGDIDRPFKTVEKGNNIGPRFGITNVARHFVNSKLVTDAKELETELLEAYQAKALCLNKQRKSNLIIPKEEKDDKDDKDEKQTGKKRKRKESEKRQPKKKKRKKDNKKKEKEPFVYVVSYGVVIQKK